MSVSFSPGSAEGLYLPTPHELKGDLIQREHPLYGVVWINPKRLSGEPCFAGTRVPVQSLFQHLEAGDSLDTFLEDFPGVTQEQAIAVLEMSRARLFDVLVPA